MTYFEKLKDPRWQKVRLEIMGRDKFTCLDCGATKKTLHVHHCFYEKGNPWDTDARFLKTLCDDCHEMRQSLENDGKRALGFLFSSVDSLTLKYFVTSLVSHCQTTEDPGVVDMAEAEHSSNVRWFVYAWENPSYRKGYEAVTGLKPKWPAKKKGAK